jgi:hypothetical protein
LGRVGRNPLEWLAKGVEEVMDRINGKLVPSENLRQVTLRGTTPGAANTEFILTHNLKLGRARQDSAGNWIPGIEFTYWLDGAGTLYESDTANWTDDAIKLKCTDASREYTVIIR